MNGVDDEKMTKIRQFLCDLPHNATGPPRKIAELLWDEEYRSKHLLGPVLRSSHTHERNQYIPNEEETKLRGKCLTKSTLVHD